MTDKTPAEREAEADAAIDAELEAMEGEEGSAEASPPPPAAEEAVDAKEPDAPPEPDAPASPDEPEPEPEVVPAPVGFSDEDRAWFATLPPEAQRTIARRESDRESEFGRKSQEIAESRKSYEALDEVLKPHRERYRLNGMSDAQAVGQLLAAEQYLQRDPVQALQYLARQYGVDLGKLNQRTQPNPYQRLEQRLMQLEGGLTQREQAQRQKQTQELTQRIESWGHQQENGKPLRPYFDQVADLMVPIMQRLKPSMPGASTEELLSKAYDSAVYANPDVRQTVLDAQMREQQAKRDAEAKAKAQKARQAASPSSDSGGSGTQKIKSIDHALNAALEEMSAS